MGTNYLAPTWRQPENTNKDKLSNYSIDFDGADYIDCGDNDMLSFGNGSSDSPFTVSSYIYAEGSSTFPFFDKYPDAGTWALREYRMEVFGTDKVVLIIYDGSAAARHEIYSDSLITRDQWQHVVITYDGRGGATAGDGVKIYINGSESTTTIVSYGTYVAMENTTTPVRIGRIGDTYADGKISQCCVFDYVLSENQRTYLNALNNPMAISGAEPIAYWPLGDNSNPTATAGYPNIVSAADSVFDFGASNEDIDAPGPYADGTQGDLTISAWVKQETLTTSYRPIVCTGFTSSMTQPQIAMCLRKSGGNKIYLFYNGGGGSNYMYTTNTVMPDINRWYHCAFVRNGSTGKLYVDGVEVPTTLSPNFSINPLVTTSDSEMTLGAWRFNSAIASLNGELSNVCLWKTALTDGVGGQIEELYNNGLPLLELSEIPQDNNLLGWYKLNQSAILIPGNPTNWTITKIGSPNYSGSNDGCFNVTAAGALQWHDNNYNELDDGNYFQWNSPAIYTSGSNIVLSSTGGSHYNPFYANEISLEYSIDGGSFVVWHTQVIPTAYGAAFTVPSTSNLTVSNNIRIRVKGLDRGSSGSYLRLLDVSVTGGTTNYTESFEGTQYGWFSGNESQPPATFSAEQWDIPDNRSAYPQSFDFIPNDRVDLPNISALDNATQFTISTWAYWDTTGNTNEWLFMATNSPSKTIRVQLELENQKIYLRFAGATGELRVNMINSAWVNVVAVFDTNAASADKMIIYLNGERAANVVYTEPTGNSPTGMNSASIGGRTDGFGFNGKISNFQIWDSALPATGTDSVETLYNNGVPLPTASVEPSSLELWTRLDDSSKWNTITSQWNIPINPITPTPWSKSALSKSVFNTFIENSSTSGIDLTNPTTTSFWLKSKTTQANFAINAGSLGGGNDLAVIGEKILVYRGSNNYRYFSVNTTIINDNNWHNLILYTPGYANADIASTRLFMDGIELDVDSTISSGTPGTPSNNPILGVGNIYLDIAEASFSNAVIWSSDQTANVTEIYNNGTPASSYTDSPILWWELNNLTSGLDDLSGNGNNAIPSGPVFAVVEEDIIAYQLGVSDGMTEANLIDENVSVANAESDTLPGTALVQSDLTRKLPFSNYSVLFNGLDESFNCGPGFQYADITVSCWVRFEDILVNYQRILQTGASGSETGFMLALDQSGDSLNKITAGWTNDGGTTQETTRSTVVVSLDTWYNVLFTRNASGIKLYIDGVDVSGAASAGWGYTSGNNLELGRKPGAGPGYLDGNLSNVAIWNSVLTQEEILDVYNNGVPTNLNTSFTPGQPEYWWPLDEDNIYFNGSVLIARDAVGSTDATGGNVIQENIVGNAPSSIANGVGSNLTIADLKGDMESSINNSYSINMADYVDGVTNPADSGRSTNVP